MPVGVCHAQEIVAVAVCHGARARKVSFDNCKPLKRVRKNINRRGRACTTNVFCLYLGFAYVPILSMIFYVTTCT